MVKEIKMSESSFVFDPDCLPVEKIDPGEEIIFDTEDANVGCIRKETDIYDDFATLLKESGGGCNPITGPVYINGVEPGDNIAVEILDIQPAYWLGQGYSALFSGLGMLQTDLFGLQEPLESRTKICKVDDSFVYFKLHNREEVLKIPKRVMIGTIGVAPVGERLLSGKMGREYGGNMDLPNVKVGSTVYFRANVPGGLLSIGDIHACQGDGEITGCALECQGRVRVRVRRIPAEAGRVLNWPIIEDEEYLAVAIPLDCKNLTAAVQAGYTELSRLVSKEYGIDVLDAYQLMNLAGQVQIGSELSASCKIKKSIFQVLV